MRAALTPRQRRLARHALGLPNATNRSFRNRYVVAVAHRDYDDWCAMVDREMADCGVVHRTTSHDYMRRFWLTRAGAQAALDPNETLCPEDFPV